MLLAQNSRGIDLFRVDVRNEGKNDSKVDEMKRLATYALPVSKKPG